MITAAIFIGIMFASGHWSMIDHLDDGEGFDVDAGEEV